MITQQMVADCFYHRDGMLYHKQVSHGNKRYLIGKEAA